MDLDEKLIIKVQFHDEIRKMPIHNEEITYDELIIMMERIFKNKLSPNDEITIKYKDEDDDLITISDDSDLSFAIESSKVLKLVLTVQSEEVEVEKNEKQLASLDLKSIRKELQIIRDYTNKLLDQIVNVNNDPNTNNASGRASTTGVGDFHGIGGKEFDPLSVGNQTNFQTVERTGSAASLGSNIRHDDINTKPNIDYAKQSPSQERHLESHEIHRPSPTLTKPQNIPMTSGLPASHMAPINAQSRDIPGAFNAPQSHPSGNQNFPPQGMTQMGSVNLPPSNLAGHYVSAPNMTGQYLPPSSMPGQNLPPSSMPGQNLPPSNMIGQNLPPSSMPGQNLPPSSMPGQHLPPSNMSGFNPSTQNDGSGKGPVYMGQSPMNGPRQPFYPGPTITSQLRPSYNVPTTGGNMMANAPQMRPNMQPTGPSYFNPQTNQIPQQQQAGQMFNPQMQQSPQNSQYGYAPNK